MNKQDRILITGSSGMLGSQIMKQLLAQGFTKILSPCSTELNLLNAHSTAEYIAEKEPTIVFHCASKVFGLGGNLKNQLLSLSQNTAINNNLLSACKNTKKIFFAGTVAAYAYPYQNLPLSESDFLASAPHYGEYGYAQAKRHALSYLEILNKECNIDYVYALFTNLYGENDRYDTNNGHVIPSLILKFYHAIRDKTDVQIWGNGTATRDFLNVKDAAMAAIYTMDNYSGILNISSGTAYSIKDVTHHLQDITGFSKKIIFDIDKPTGIQERSVSNNLLKKIGFMPEYDLHSGLEEAYRWFTNNIDRIRQ